MSIPFAFADDVESVGVRQAHVAHLDGTYATREQLFDALTRALKLPGHFGRNWDALDECLRDLSWIDGHRVVLFHETLPALGADATTTYLEILRDAVLDWRSDLDDELVVGFRAELREAVVGHLSDA